MAMNRESGTMIIDGHILSDRDLEIFWTFHESGKYAEAAKKLGVSRDTVKRIVTSPWAQKLFDTKVKAINDSFMHRLQEMDEDALTAYKEIITGDRSDDKSTMSAAKLIELRMKAGAKPILDTRSVTTNVHNEQKNTFVSVTAEQMKGMSPEELIELNRTGELPERMRVSEKPPAPMEFPQELPADVLAVQTVQRNEKRQALAVEPDAQQDS